MNRAIKSKFAMSVLSVAISASLSTVAQAQMLEELVVTATKRPVGLQDVPIAVSVMNAEKIGEQGIGSLGDLAVFMPNVHIAETNSNNAIFIRGVGSGNNAGFEQSVGTFIDGVYFGRGQASRTAFLDLSRVEILKGPQSTLFGKNTVAGAINITTAAPTEEFEGTIEGTLEPEFDGWSSTLTLSGPLTDTLGARLVLKKEESDGYMDNTFLDQEERQEEDQIGRLTLSWQALDNLYLTLKAEHGETETEGRQFMYSIASPTATAFHQTFDPNFSADFDYDRSAGNNPTRFGTEADFHESEWDIFTLKAEWEIGEFNLTSITGYVDYEYDAYQDVDFGPAPFLARARSEHHKQFTQEIILSSPTDGPVEYLAGLYYQDEDLTHDRATDVAAELLPGFDASFNHTSINEFQQDSKTWSAFAQVTWHVRDDFRVIAGARYSDDEKEFEKDSYAADIYTENSNLALSAVADALNIATNHSFNSEGAIRCPTPATCVSDPNFDNKRNEDHWTGDITLQWDITGDVMSYFKVSNGYKAGGFDEDNSRGRLDAQIFEDESVESVEMGVKMELWDGRARVNAAVFHNQFTDLQVSTFDGGAGFVVGNAAEATSQGVEADAVIALSESLTLKGSLS